MYAVVFPGQGSQYPGMGHDFYSQVSSLRPLFEEAEDILHLPLKKILFDGSTDELRNTRYAQPALFLISMVTMAFLEQEQGQKFFSFFAGHSLGEYSALCAAGVFSFSVGLELIKKRSEIMGRKNSPHVGMMAILGIGKEEIESFLKTVDLEEGICEIANDNAPLQVVLSGHLSCLEKISQKLSLEKTVRCVFLNVSGAFHSSLMANEQKEFSKIVDHVSFHSPCAPVVTNISGQAQVSSLILKEHVKNQMTSPVLWRKSQLSLASYKVTHLIEIGPGKVLSGLAKKTIPFISSVSVGSLKEVQEWSYQETPLSSLASQ